MPVGRVTCPLLWTAALAAAQPCGLSLNTGGTAPASLRYDCLTPVAQVAGPRCLAGDPLLGCAAARWSLVVAMALGHIWHGPRCSPAGLGQVALESRSCPWPGGLAASPRCVQPWGCGLLRRVPPPRSVRVRVRCPGPLGACSPVRPLCVPCVVSVATWHLLPVRALCAACVCCWWLRRGHPPSSLCFCPCFFHSFVWCPRSFVFALLLFSDAFWRLLIPLFCFFFGRKWKRGACPLQAQAWATGAAVQQCCLPCLDVRRWCFVGGCPLGVRHVRPDVHGCMLGWVRLCVSLRLGSSTSLNCPKPGVLLLSRRYLHLRGNDI